MMDNNKPNLFPGIDLFKLIGSIVVVAIHSHPFESHPLPVVVEPFYVLLCNTAVPFFFMATGFLLGYKVIDEQQLR